MAQGWCDWGGINKFWILGGHENFISLWNSTKSGAKTKKMVFALKTTQFSKKFGLLLQKSAKFLETWGEDKKKKVFISKYTRIFMNSWVQPHKQTIFIAKSTNKQFLLTNSGVTTSILGVSGLELHSSCTEPVNFFEAQPSLGRAQFSFVGAREVIWVGTAPNAPSWRQA